MSHITLAQQGLAAVDAQKWDEAVAKLSQALKTSTNPGWLLARSKALVGLKRFREALADGDLAWHAAHERNRRPLMVDAHYRRAVAYYRMGQYANADCCCLFAMRLAKGFPAVEGDDVVRAAWMDGEGRWTATRRDAMDEARADDFNAGKEADGMQLAIQGAKARANIAEWRLASTLRMQSLGAMEKLPADDAARIVTVSLKPRKTALADVARVKEAHEAPQPAPSQPAAEPPVPRRDTPLRLQEFQSNATMSVSIFSKGVDKEKLAVEFRPRAVRLDPVVFPNGEAREFRLHLWGEIDPSASKYTVFPSKVELSLAKKTPAKWPLLLKAEEQEAEEQEADEGKAGDSQQRHAPQPVEPKAPPGSAEAEAEAEGPAAAAAGPQPEPARAGAAPAYPSSARSGPKDWDKIGADVGDDDEADVNDFFKKIYKNASPEQQRAMMKSFTESNGTSLSTSWEDVKDRTVATVPPEGVEVRKWQ